MKNFNSSSKLRQTQVRVVLSKSYDGNAVVFDDIDISDNLLYPLQRITLLYERAENDIVELTGYYLNNVPRQSTEERFDFVLDKPLSAFGVTSMPQDASLYYYSSFVNSTDYDYLAKTDAIHELEGVESLYENKSTTIQQPQNYSRLGTPGLITGEQQNKLNRLFKYVKFSGIELNNTTWITLALIKCDSDFDFTTRIKLKNNELYADFSFYCYTDNENNLQRYLAINGFEHINEVTRKNLLLRFSKETGTKSGENISMIRVEAQVDNGGSKNFFVDVAVTQFDNLLNQQTSGIEGITKKPITLNKSEYILVEQGTIGFTSATKLTLVVDGQSRLYPKLQTSGDLNEMVYPGYFYTKPNYVTNFDHRPLRSSDPIQYYEEGFELLVLAFENFILQEYTVISSDGSNPQTPEILRRVCVNGVWQPWKGYSYSDHTHRLEDLTATANSTHFTQAEKDQLKKLSGAVSYWKGTVASPNDIKSQEGVKNYDVYIVQNSAQGRPGLYQYFNGNVIPLTIEALESYTGISMSSIPDKGLITKDFYNYIISVGIGKKKQNSDNGYIHTQNSDGIYNGSIQNFIDIVKRSSSISVGENSIAFGFGSTRALNSYSVAIGTNVDDTFVGIGSDLNGVNRGVLIGQGLKNTNGVALGQYNNDVTEGFAVGIGSSDTNRENLFEVGMDKRVTADGFKTYTDHISERGADVLTSDGGTRSLEYFGTQEDIDSLKEEKLDKGGTMYMKLVPVSGETYEVNLAFDTDTVIVSTPEGNILVNSYGETTLPCGISINPNAGDMGQVTIPASIAMGGTELVLEPVETEDEILPIELIGKYITTGLTYYPTVINFEDYTITYNNGDVVPWFEEK